MPRPQLTQRQRARRAALGERLRHERQAAQLSQQALADGAGLTKRDVQRFECGERSIPADALPDICRALGITPARLLGEAEHAALRVA